MINITLSNNMFDYFETKWRRYGMVNHTANSKWRYYIETNYAYGRLTTYYTMPNKKGIWKIYSKKFSVLLYHLEFYISENCPKISLLKSLKLISGGKPAH